MTPIHVWSGVSALRRTCVLAVLLAAGANCAWGQRALPEKATLPETVTWLRDVITKSGGYSYTKSGAAVRDRLSYRIGDAGRCHISWRPEADGDEEMRIAHPGGGLDQEFSVVEPGSAHVQAVDVAKIEGESTDTLFRLEKQGYWRVTARWAYVPNDGGDEPFGFVFGDERLASEVALALDHAIELCSGPQNDVGVGCKTVNEKVDMHYGGAGPTFINNADYTIVCVRRFWGALTGSETLPGTDITIQLLRGPSFEIGQAGFIEIKPGEHYSPAQLPGAHPVASTLTAAEDIRCYPKGETDTMKNACSDLHLRTGR